MNWTKRFDFNNDKLNLIILQIEWTLAEMEEDRDSDSDDEIEYSGMIQPPLIKQLRTILSEYPDDGQILKV